MKLQINYLENEIIINKGEINSIEVENKTYFYRIIKDLISYNDGGSENVIFYDDIGEIKLENKISLIIDYFNFDLHIKKYTTKILKKIDDEISENERIDLAKIYVKLSEKINKIINNFDFNIEINNDFELEKTLKYLNIGISSKENILENLMLLIELEKTLRLSNLIVFVNLKEYLEKEELVELYKYAIYNDVQLLLIDYRSYGVSLQYEKKLIIDSNLEEFLI